MPGTQGKCLSETLHRFASTMCCVDWVMPVLTAPDHAGNDAESRWLLNAVQLGKKMFTGKKQKESCGCDGGRWWHQIGACGAGDAKWR